MEGANVSPQQNDKSWADTVSRMPSRPGGLWDCDSQGLSEASEIVSLHLLWGGGCQLADTIDILTIYVHKGVVNSGRHDTPHIRKSSLDHDSGGKNSGCQ